MSTEERKEKEVEEEKLLNKLEKMYGKLHQAIKNNSSQRETNEQ
jgi:hypothetical protein